MMMLYNFFLVMSGIAAYGAGIFLLMAAVWYAVDCFEVHVIIQPKHQDDDEG